MTRVPHKAAEIGVFRETDHRRTVPFFKLARGSSASLPLSASTSPGQPTTASQDWTALSGTVTIITVPVGSAFLLNAESGIMNPRGPQTMKLTLKGAIAAICLTASFAAPVAAGPLEDAIAAYGKGNYATALLLLRPLAEQGTARAQILLGVMYSRGQGMAQNYGEAMKWYRRAADHGDATAQVAVGAMYANGLGVPQDHAKAMEWFRKAADQGDAHAQNDLGSMYDRGDGVPQDYAEAMKWYRRAANQGYANAQSNIAIMYNNGHGVPQDYAEGLKWSRLAAEQGFAAAQYLVASAYANGQSVPQNYTEAAKWAQRAADQGFAIAQYYLGLAYGNGQGVSQDFVQSYMWFDVSAARGYQDAVQGRDAAAKQMTVAQIEEAQKLARDWKPTANPTGLLLR
jgi:uncharacterized protein